MNRTLRILLLLPVLMLLSACQTSNHFHKQWRTWDPPTPAGSHALFKKTEPPPTPQSPWDGRWAGHWTSDKHKAPFSSEPSGGEVRCILTKLDPYQYRANFNAKWEKIFHGTYVSMLYGHARGKTLHLKGQWPVSKIFGGDYHYEGTVTPDKFILHFSSRYDSGTMEMTKVP